MTLPTTAANDVAPDADQDVHNPHRARRSSLRRRFVAGTAAITVAILGVAAFAGNASLHETLAGQNDARLRDAANRSALLVERVLGERGRQMQLITSAPLVVEAARGGGEAARQRGLTQLSVEALEQRFKDTRSLQIDPAAIAYLRDFDSTFDIAEVMVTDANGFNAVTTNPSSDFVQSDEAWWQRAWQTGSSPAMATEDAASKRAVVELARAVVSGRGATAQRLGVVKVKFGLTWLDSALVQASDGSAIRVELVDSAGRVVSSSGTGTRFRVLPGFDAISRASNEGVFTYRGGSIPYRAAAALTNGGSWRVVAQMEERVALGAYRAARLALFAGVVVLLVGAIGGIVLVSRFIEQRVTGPAAELAALAEAVAAGDLSRQVRQIHSDDEIGRLARAIAAMIVELRRLASAMVAASRDTAAMSAEITAGSEEMAASAGEIASTASQLSAQSSSMASTIQTLAGSADELVRLAADMDSGAHEGVERNTRLRALATENRAKLDESTQALALLSDQVESGAQAVEQLAAASAEVRTFVTLVQKLARQSKLLALNAAMEAARAGEHGEGFAIVATEVRRLSAMSSDAAERTQRIVAEVLSGIEQSRASSERAVGTVATVRSATEHGSASFIEIEKAVADAEGWTSAVERTASIANALANDIRARLGSLAQGTDSFAAAMEEVAASSEQQSASTEEIAAAAATLAAAAERLSKITSGLRVEQTPGSLATVLPIVPLPVQAAVPVVGVPVLGQA